MPLLGACHHTCIAQLNAPSWRNSKSCKVSWMRDFGPFAKHVLSVLLKTSHHISAKLPNYFIHTINQTFVEKKDTSWHKFFKSGCKFFLIFQYLNTGNSPLMKGNEWLNIGFGMCVIVSCLVGAGRVVIVVVVVMRPYSPYRHIDIDNIWMYLEEF